ncbi:MAG: hypothetical protein GY811_15485 [Myxococcales bacterium]|nr:hypothetical protein [Myxococcales bacterium]
MSLGFTVEVIFVDGRREQHEFGEEHVTVGSSPDAHLCLPLEEMSPQHVLIVARPNGCWVSAARGAATPVLLDGHIVEGQEVKWGAELDVGTVTLRITEPSETLRAKEQSVRTALKLGGLVVAALVVFYMLQERVVRAPRAPASAPELFEEVVKKCNVETAESFQRGQELKVAAMAYWERYSFAAQEGIRAARLYGEASSCFSADGRTIFASKMLSERQTVQDRVNRDYQTLHLQLKRALKDGEHTQAKQHLNKLSSYVEHRAGEYLDWLGRVRRYLRERGQ